MDSQSTGRLGAVHARWIGEPADGCQRAQAEGRAVSRRRPPRTRWCAAHGAACYGRSVKIAVVIPALDEAERVVGAIESAVAPDVDVVVVDGGSRDDTRQRAAAAGARVVASGPGRARQLQTGVRETRSDVVVFLHADTRLPPGFADALRASLTDSRVVGGALVP